MRRAAALVVALVLCAGCGGRANVYEVAPDDPKGATRTLALPDPIPAVPAFRIELERSTQPADLAKIAKTPGVAAVGQVAVKKMQVHGADGARAALRVGAASPLDYRSVAPSSTRDADFVWTALMGGKAVVTFEAAEKLGLAEGGTIAINGSELQVGAFADNGNPNIADVLVADTVGAGFGLKNPGVLVVGVGSGATVQSVGSKLRKRVGDRAAIKKLLPQNSAAAAAAPPPQPSGSASGGVIGSMSFKILKSGFIVPDPAWVAANISIGEVPILGTVTCHRLMFGQLRAAMSEIENEGLADEIRTVDGCYVPRFIDRDPGKPLSMHAFGLAIDINAATNRLGTRGNMDPRIVAIFQKWGFTWGGGWARPDPMHFELARLIST